MAVREMQEAFRSEIMDYAVIRSDKKEGILLSCVSVEERMLKQFLDMCQELGIEVKSVTAPMEGLLRILRRLDNFQDKTAVNLFFEDGAVTSVLSEVGQYKYSSRSRLFSEPGTLDFGTEIVRNVSGILQFHAASKSEHTITDVYYAGCPADVFDVSREGLSAMNLQVAKMGTVNGVALPPGTDFSEWLPCVGAMLNGVRDAHDINLLSSYKKNHEKEKPQDSALKQLILPAAAAGVCLLLYGGMQLLNLGEQGKIVGITQWMKSASVQEAYEESLALDREKAKLQGAIFQTANINNNRETYPKLTDDMMDRIAAAGGEGITSNISGYDRETGEMTFEAVSEAAIDIPSYIRRLDKTELFHSVEYTGYVFENDAYTLSLLCTLEGNEKGGAEE